MPPIQPGEALITTITQRGWTLRVFAKGGTMGSVGILSDQFIERGAIHVPSRQLLLRCLPAGADVVERYAAFLRTFGADIATLGEYQCVRLSEAALLAQSAALAEHVCALACVYGGAP